MTEEGSRNHNESSVPRIGSNQQTRKYNNVTVFLEFRPLTRDFKWAFYQKKIVKIAGVEKTIDKCMRSAARYIDHIQPKPEETL